MGGLGESVGMGIARRAWWGGALLAAVVLVGAVVPAKASPPPYAGTREDRQCPNQWGVPRSLGLTDFQPTNCHPATAAGTDGRVSAAVDLTSPQPGSPIAVDSTLGAATAHATRAFTVPGGTYSQTFTVQVHVDAASSTVQGDAPAANTLVYSWTAVNGWFSHPDCSDCQIMTPVRNSALTVSYAAYTGGTTQLSDVTRSVQFTVQRAGGGPIPAGTATIGGGLMAYAYDQSSGRWGYANTASASASGTVTFLG